MPVVLALLALSPALGFAALLYFFDAHEREPLWALSLLFVAGVLCVPLAGVLELAADGPVPYLDAMRAGRRDAVLFGCFAVVAPVEELLKLGAVALLARRKLMNEPVDGVVYAGMAALGFAACEGILVSRSDNAATMVARALLATPGHLCFSALWGAGLGALRYWGRPALPAALASLCASLLAHGAYDYLLIADGGAQRGGVVAVLASAAVIAALLFRMLLQASPFRGATTRAGRCASCTHRHGAQVRFCAGCGAALTSPVDAPVPLGFAATLLAFSSQGLALVSGSVLVARLSGQSAPALWRRALSTLSVHTLLAFSVAALGAALAGLCVRAFQGRYAVLEALVATALVLLCVFLFLALTHPAALLRALSLAPLALGVSGWVAWRGTRA